VEKIGISGSLDVHSRFDSHGEKVID